METRPVVAIVGIGGVFPGAGNLAQFWDNIVHARDQAREPPPGRWLLALADVYAAQGPQPDKVYSKRACFVENFTLDTSGLDIEAGFLAGLDPMFHLLLQAGNQAWRDGITTTIDKERAGIIIGNIVLPTETASALADELLGPVLEQQVLGRSRAGTSVNKLNRYVAGLPAGILARALGLGGGSYTLDAACASSLYAVKYAMDELQAGRADVMLAGGLSRPDSLYTQMGFSALHAISASGRCAPFDHKADGLVVGEGCGMLLLKRLDDALRDGDRIYAILRGTGLSNDIGGNLMAPDSEGQLRAMRAAYQQAGWQPSDVDLIECHGTGTPVGDVVEFNSLRSLWGEEKNAQPCVIGSVKSNIGHLLTAAGSA
ncbi:MAG: 3-hydroxyacyl-ACP dehydratase, partial [Gammaproteobacteria bacterium]|nr:3-hydroxyacyl-ACP dehydratase [Gammaproteobacteria bacterium]